MNAPVRCVCGGRPFSPRPPTRFWQPHRSKRPSASRSVRRGWHLSIPVPRAHGRSKGWGPEPSTDPPVTREATGRLAHGTREHPPEWDADPRDGRPRAAEEGTSTRAGPGGRAEPATGTAAARKHLEGITPVAGPGDAGSPGTVQSVGAPKYVACLLSPLVQVEVAVVSNGKGPVYNKLL